MKDVVHLRVAQRDVDESAGARASLARPPSLTMLSFLVSEKLEQYVESLPLETWKTQANGEA